MSTTEQAFGSPYRIPVEIDPQVLKERAEREMQDSVYSLFEGKTCSEVQRAFKDIFNKGWEFSDVSVSDKWRSGRNDYSETCKLDLKDPKTGASRGYKADFKADADHESDISLFKLNFPSWGLELGINGEINMLQGKLDEDKIFGKKKIKAEIEKLYAGLVKAKELAAKYIAFETQYTALRLLNRCLRRAANQDPSQAPIVEEAEARAWGYLSRNFADFLKRVEEIEQMTGITLDEEEKMKLKRYAEQDPPK